MRGPVDLEKAPNVEVRVSLGGAEPRVAKQFLDGSEVRAGLQQMRREGVPQRMWAQGARHGRRLCGMPDHAVHTSRRQSPTALIEKDGMTLAHVRRRALAAPG